MDGIIELCDDLNTPMEQQEVMENETIHCSPASSYDSWDATPIKKQNSTSFCGIEEFVHESIALYMSDEVPSSEGRHLDLKEALQYWSTSDIPFLPEIFLKMILD